VREDRKYVGEESPQLADDPSNPVGERQKIRWQRRKKKYVVVSMAPLRLVFQRQLAFLPNNIQLQKLTCESLIYLKGRLCSESFEWWRGSHVDISRVNRTEGKKQP
jgi:hypothetical protein